MPHAPRLALLLLLALPGPALAELVPQPPLAPDIAALPRLAVDVDIAAQVNGQLALLDQRDLDAVLCYGGPPDDPFRTVEVLADGPDFLSLLIATSSFCQGAAHPWWNQRIVTFDLATGVETDLRDMLPFSPNDPDSALAVLFLNTVGDLPGECVVAYAAALRDGFLGFDLGLSEAQAALVLWPQGLAYVETPCLDLALVPLDRLREAGFDPRLIRALEQETGD
jgi:hypothetical protein